MVRRLVLLGIALLSLHAFAAEGAELQRFLVTARTPANQSRLRAATNALAAPMHRLRAFPFASSFAADLSENEAVQLRANGFAVEPIVERFADAMDDERAPAASAPAASAPAASAPATADVQEVPWGINAIHAPQVWQVTRGEGVNVAVLDTGIDAEHPDLKDVYKGGYNTFDPSLPPKDGHRHGTHVAGTIAAADNAIGVVGVAPGVKLWSVKVLDDDGRGSNESVVAGFNWVMEKAKTTGGRWVMNLSLGASTTSEAEEAAVSNAISANIIVIASAGNRADQNLRYPAKYRDVIAVGAVDPTDKRASFSSYGAGMTVVAPGTDVRSTFIAGINDSSEVQTLGGNTLESWWIIGSPYGSVTANIVDCGQGAPEEFPPNVQGQIALVHRGKFLFRELARNAKEAGAAAMILAQRPSDTTAPAGFTFYPKEPDAFWSAYDFPLSVAVMYAEGEELRTHNGPVTVAFRPSRYGIMNGTSMAAPHATGTAALVLSLAPDIPVAQLEFILRTTARDIYEKGWDKESAWGVVDALKAAQFVAPQRFGVPPPVVKPPSHRRSVR
ncbi:MAG: S8 family serine peptidase [Acidobacteriota bacterium]|nr:S8 family serine peptidase [Acidobacteriota bacterium]